MNKIVYKKIKYNKINDHFLNGYIRFQDTTQVYYMNNKEMDLKDEKFHEDWNQEKLIEISRQLKLVVKNGGVLYGAYDQKQIVGFSIIENKLFNEKYINMPYMHTSKGYRGYGIGKYLFYLLALEAEKLGAKKLYISTHPAYETQKFYMGIGCSQTKQINQKLLALETDDIQHEYHLDYIRDVHRIIELELQTHLKLSATVVMKIATLLYKYLPEDETAFLSICKTLVASDTRSVFSLGTLFMKRRTSIIRDNNMDYFEEILVNHIHEWDQVDQYCYRVLNPMIELKEAYYEYLLKWSDSRNKDVRRASLVAMIRTGQKLHLEYDFDKMIYLVEKLKKDQDIHVRKAVGWVLKCSYLTYPTEIEAYLRLNVQNLDRLIFRYALEHIEEPLRFELINL